MEKLDMLKPIEKKIGQWINYECNKPTIPYEGNEEIHDIYRKENDLDCQLTDGNLKADTIFSLWLPLRFTLRKINGYSLNIPDKVKERKKHLDFLVELGSNSSSYLPVDNSLVEKLSRLFELGMKRENVMILPDRIINCKRGSKPYYDYMPHFLNDCFQGGNFSKYFSNDEELQKWIETQHLQMFFENGSVKKSEIKDLSGSGSVQNNKPEKVEAMLDNYIDVLEARVEFY
ncbi:MAG: hypothetical protein ACYDG2_10870 [Ruminiclostridium sp.]